MIFFCCTGVKKLKILKNKIKKTVDTKKTL